MTCWRENLKAGSKVIAGSKIIRINRWTVDTVQTITRTTKTQLTLGDTRLNRNSLEIREATDEEVLKIELDLKRYSLIEELSNLLDGNNDELTIENLSKAIKALKT